jgi:RNA polymerase sigma-70 factor (ECF subfamily)
METSILIARAQEGDEIAFAALLKQHRAKVYTRCLGMLRNPADAEDLTQDVFFHLHLKIRQFDGRSTFSTWLYKLTTNLVLMHLRSKTPDASSLDDMDREPADTRSEVDHVAVEGIINQLPVRLRRVVWLRMVEGYSVNETAEKLGVGPMVVVRRCGDAKNILREKLGAQERVTTNTVLTLPPIAPKKTTRIVMLHQDRVLSTLPLC